MKSASAAELRHDCFDLIMAGFAPAIFVSRALRLHAVALEDAVAGRAQPGAVLLQALLHGTVIAEILATEARGVTRTGLLFLRRALMALGERGRDISDDQEEG
jgi:hypothetical protein